MVRILVGLGPVFPRRFGWQPGRDRDCGDARILGARPALVEVVEVVAPGAPHVGERQLVGRAVDALAQAAQMAHASKAKSRKTPWDTYGKKGEARSAIVRACGLRRRWRHTR